MVTRKELFGRPGPFTHEAFFELMLGYINELREEQGLPEIPKQQAMDLAANHISHLTPYGD